MRTDITIDNRKVNLPKVEFFGFNKTYAKKGFIVQWQYPNSTGVFTGRVIGRISHGISNTGKNESLKDYLVIAQLSNDLTFTYERWVHPSWIIICYDPQDLGHRDVVTFLGFFFGKDFIRVSNDNLRQWIYSSTNKPEQIN